jgi:hypothetical protein
MDQVLESSFDDVCSILAEIWTKRDDIEYADFFQFNLLGVTLAYAFSEELIDDLGPDAIDLIEESFDAFLDEHEIDDTGFETLTEVLEAIKEND